MPTSPPEGLKSTALYPLHCRAQGHMVPFAKYHMPLYYKLGMMKEHSHTREKAGLFDVSHMGQVLLSSDDGKATTILNHLAALVPSPVSKLKPGQCQYTVLTNDEGGTIDDLLIEVLNDQRVLLVVNAARKDVDIQHLNEHLPATISSQMLEDKALLALQGPLAESILNTIVPGVKHLTFMTGSHFTWEDAQLWVTRSGYSGEDGFEISLPNDIAVAFAEQLLASDEVELIGLGARDSLRLEAGLPLYGHELDQHRSFIEANMAWLVGQPKPDELSCLGGDKLTEQLSSSTDMKRVGIQVNVRAIAREGCEVLNEEAQNIGHVTSGCFSPTLQAPIAMGYVKKEFAKVGTPLLVVIRDTPQPAQVVKLPFVAPKYKR